MIRVVSAVRAKPIMNPASCAPTYHTIRVLVGQRHTHVLVFLKKCGESLLTLTALLDYYRVYKKPFYVCMKEFKIDALMVFRRADIVVATN